MSDMYAMDTRRNGRTIREHFGNKYSHKVTRSSALPNFQSLNNARAINAALKAILFSFRWYKIISVWKWELFSELINRTHFLQNTTWLLLLYAVIFEISNRFEVSFRLLGKLQRDFTAATFQTIAKLYCICANYIFKLMQT